MNIPEQLKWILDWERARLPPDTVFPRVGQIWETLQDSEIPFMPWCSIPGRVLRGGTARLRQGERVRVVSVDDPAKPLLLSLEPVRYVELHETIVPDQVRKAPGYLKYTLGAKTDYLNEHFKLVKDAA